MAITMTTRTSLTHLLFFSFFVFSAVALPKASSYENHEELNPDFHLFWTPNVASATIHVAMRARTTGWLALGISEVGSMVGSDAIVGWINSTNSSAPVVFLTDRFLFNRSRNATGVALDSQQDVHLVGGQQEYNQSTGDTWTTIHFWRLLDTKDCNDRAIVPGQGQYFIWAIGTTTATSYHGTSRGSAFLTLVPSTIPSILSPPGSPPGITSASKLKRAAFPRSVGKLAAADVSATQSGSHQARAPARAATTATANSTTTSATLSASSLVLVEPSQGEGRDARLMEFLMSDYAVPAQETTYTCRAFEINLPSKIHAVEWGFHQNATQNSTLHHALLYACEDGQDKRLPPGTGTFDCLQDTICYTTVAGWALGGQPFTLPDQAGLPIGPGYYTKFVLQIHYTNPSSAPGIVDSSGMYYRLADDLRANDAGFMLVGPVDYHNLIRIPPSQPSWTQDSVCPSQCTEAILGNTTDGTTGVKIVASLNHLHTTGKQLFTEVIRKGRTVQTLDRQDYYDFAMQQWVSLPPFTLLPGDELRTRCVWDTTGRKNVTLGGPATHDEMCINYLVYYPMNPKKAMSSCFDFCAAYDPSTGGFASSPSTPNLTTWYTCGSPSYQLFDSRTSCSYEGKFGSPQPFTSLNGCPTSTLLSQSDRSPSLISMPAELGTGMPPQAHTCLLQLPSGESRAFEACSQLPGGFQLLWSASSVQGGSGPNSSVVLAVTARHDGWIGVGISPRGGMLGASAIIGYAEPQGTINVAQYYLGDDIRRPIIGGQLSASQLSGQSSGGNITLFATLSLPTEQVTPITVVWAKGVVMDGELRQHASSDAHITSMTLLEAATPAKSSGAGPRAVLLRIAILCLIITLSM